jgi:hypothetical protein
MKIEKRPIEFKVWDKEYKKFLYVNPHMSLDLMGNVYNLQNGEGNDIYQLFQYTGLKDMHGNKIYEGDILINPTIPALFNWLVSFYDGAFVLQNIGIDNYLHTDRYRLTQGDCLNREIVGHINTMEL